MRGDWISSVESPVPGTAEGKPTFLFFTSYEKTIFSLEPRGGLEAANLPGLFQRLPLPLSAFPLFPSVPYHRAYLIPGKDEWL